MRKIVLVAITLALLGVFVPAPVGAVTYYITNVTELQDMESDLAGDYILSNNIDASATSGWNGGEGFDPVGGSGAEFTGTLDGQGYIISDLYINRGGSAGQALFGVCKGIGGGHVTLSNIILINATITGSNTVATLCARADENCDIEDCYSTGTVVASSISIAGGLVAHLYHSTATISRSASTASVTAEFSVGGLVGITVIGSTIADCYARGSVSVVRPGLTGSNGGGLVGLHAGVITNSYSTGLVSCTAGSCFHIGGLTGSTAGSATNSFWDTETSCQATSGAGTGKTTTEMTTESTFTNAGWDLTTIWDMKQYVNDGYPYLQWWYDPTPFASWDQILWFEPIIIISGTTLPDRAGTAQNGAITWGDNPAGITIDMGELVSGNQPPIVSSPDNPATSVPDMTGESGQPDWTATQPTLPDNPFYPVVDLISGQMNIPLWLVWVILAILILLVIMAVSFKYAPHQLITALAGGGWCAFMYHMGIFPFWVMFIFAAMALAIVIGERTPTVS